MKRLKTILQFINDKDIVADIGCDHGYLLKMAIKDKNILKGYAIDNKIGPLNSAKTNLYSFSNVEFILSDGLISVDKDDINCVVIAGMGGMLINKIVEDSLSKFNKIKKIILCPNRNIDKVRSFFNEKGFMIVDEDIVYEDGKYYEILVIEKGEQKLTDKELFFGHTLLEKRTETFIAKWQEYYDKIKNIENKSDEIKLIEEVLYESE